MGEYLNEENYQRYNRKVKKVGKILLIVGLVLLVISIALIVIGSVNFGNNALLENEKGVLSGMGFFAIGSFMSVFSFAIFAAGGMCLMVAHRREITAYTTQQVMPIAKEGAEEMAPAAGKVAEEITKGVKKGLNKKD
jgi:hypothetical protein